MLVNGNHSHSQSSFPIELNVTPMEINEDAGMTSEPSDESVPIKDPTE